MDRYVVMRENPYLAKWCSRLMDVLVRVSHRVICREEFDKVWSEVSSPLLEEPKGLFQKIVHSVTPVREQAVSSPTHHRRSDCIILPNESKWCPSEQTAQFTQHCAKLLAEFEKEMSTELSGVALAAFTDTAGEKEKTYDTLLFPTVQFARAHLYHDSYVVQHLLRLLTDQDHLFLTSPYLNMYSDFVEEILHNTNSNQNKSCYFDAITASTITNGWQGHKGMAGRIPYFYLQLERSFYYLMKYYHALHRVRVREFSREGFTFHAKGLWVMERGEQKDQDTTQPPYLVAYGSTNYGYRSVHKDVEAEVFLFTVNQTLRDSLRRELQLLLDDSITVEEERFLGLNGKFQPVVSVMAQMGQNFL
ncbi:CDP-diacylglycerol--glycerol-3-phosphate 3-phosphatidyltransferase [Angomonas deanei]|nr:CDP-diacylglycerol--glycerol-3-phosphate 3-phosphatidyltransferase [Angomonas deanei]|eukprot:EPY24955.1 CDP-diacylglycerol--glycerol-3-phosphate 3-phosphatidyltransferase [Angomonas deanei]